MSEINIPLLDLAKFCHKLQSQLSSKDKEIERLKAENEKWRRPFDQERLDDIKKQASHKDSLAAQAVYIIALEHALKCKEAIKKEVTNKKPIMSVTAPVVDEQVRVFIEGIDTPLIVRKGDELIISVDTISIKTVGDKI